MGLNGYAFGNIPTRMTQSSAPDSHLSPAEAFRRAVEAIGSQQAVARLVGKTQSAVSKRLSSGAGIWPEDALTVERESGISRYALRPDLYPREDILPAKGEDDRLNGVRG